MSVLKLAKLWGYCTDVDLTRDGNIFYMWIFGNKLFFSQPWTFPPQLWLILLYYYKPLCQSSET